MRLGSVFLALIPAAITAQHGVLQTGASPAMTSDTPSATASPLCYYDGAPRACPADAIATPTTAYNNELRREADNLQKRLHCYHTDGVRTCESGVPASLDIYATSTRVNTTTTAQSVATKEPTGGADSVIWDGGMLAAGAALLLFV